MCRDFRRIVVHIASCYGGSRHLLESLYSQYHQNIGHDPCEGIVVKRAHRLNGSFVFARS